MDRDSSMIKRPRKRQKSGKPAAGAQPLGTLSSLTDDAGKDDEERKLESLLFGVPYVPSTGEDNILVIPEEDDEGDSMGWAGGKELENLMDTDLFFVDDNGPAGPSHISEPVSPSDDDDHSGEEDANEDGPHSEVDDAPEPEEAEAENQPEPPPVKSGRKAAWEDPDDITLQVSLASDKRLRKLRDAPSEDAVGGREYERRLRRQFEKINPAPDWAANARKRLRLHKSKRPRPSDCASEGEEDIVTELTSSTRGILDSSRSSKALPQGTLAIERLRDVNQSAKAEGAIKAIQFHPSPQVPVVLVASVDRRVRLFNVDGSTNPHLQTLHIPSMPVSNALFHPSGSSVLLTGPRPFFYTYDLQTGTTQRSPRGLWGTTFGNTNPSAQDSSMEICAFNSTGEYLAIAGRRGYIHLMDWKSGAGQVVGSLKMNAGVKSMWWARGGASEGRELMTLGEDSEIYVWDVRERRCIRRWRDDGGFGSHIMEGDPKGDYLAIGSNTGLVNVYGGEGMSLSNTAPPKPLKTLGNLTTSISTMRFNNDSQLLAIASKTKKDQMRMVHLPSLTAFGNWPTSKTPLGHITAIDFSSRSEYVAIGNNRGRVLLYSLRDYAMH